LTGVTDKANQQQLRAEQWKQREREVDVHVSAGEVTIHCDGDAFLGHLDELDAGYAAVKDNPAYPYESEDERAAARTRRNARQKAAAE
jgi:hypothetical protein